MITVKSAFESDISITSRVSGGFAVVGCINRLNVNETFKHANDARQYIRQLDALYPHFAVFDATECVL